MSRKQDEKNWTMVISSNKKFFDLNLRETLRYKDLIWMFFKRNYNAQYKQTILGPIWFILNPLLTTLIFTVVFGGLAHTNTNESIVPNFLFYMAGNTLWSYFSYCLTNTSSTFTANSAIFGKVYFPRITVPISTILFGLISFFIQLIMFIIIYVVCICSNIGSMVPNLSLLMLPLLILEIAMIGFGLGVIIASVTTKYRDLAVLVTFGVQLLMYATPVIFEAPATGVLSVILKINPLTSIFDVFRYAFFGTGGLCLWQIIYTLVFAIVIFFSSIALFNKVEKSFMDVI